MEGIIRNMNWIKIIFFVIYLSGQKAEGFAQSNKSAAFFRVINSGKKGKDKLTDAINGTGWLQYRDSIIKGEFLLSNDGFVVVQKIDGKWFAYGDTLVRKMVINNNKGNLYLNRLVRYDNQLWRLLKDTLGIEIYDKSFDLNRSVRAINYNSLLFRKDSLYIPAVTFWVTSTKRSIIRIINNLMGNRVKPNMFRSKEVLMEQLLQNSKNVWSVSISKP